MTRANGERRAIRGRVRSVGRGWLRVERWVGGVLHIRGGRFSASYCFRVPLTIYSIGLIRYYFLRLLWQRTWTTVQVERHEVFRPT